MPEAIRQPFLFTILDGSKLFYLKQTFFIKLDGILEVELI